jgi:LysM repeat protein
MSSQLNLDVNDMVHIVQKGDTLSSIAKVYGTTYQKLAEYNKISAPYSLKIGQVLNLIQVYDEAIEFVDSEDNLLSLVDYILYLENGTQVLGTTDDKGLSQKISMSIKIGIVDFDFLIDSSPIEQEFEYIATEELI